MKYTLFTLLLYISLSISGISAQQTYPIYVTPSLTPPYSLILSDYSQIGSQRLVVTIQVRDVTVTNLPVRLNLKIENMTGITIETIPTAPVTPIFLSGGEVSVLFGDDMRDYFNLNNLQFKGFSKDEYRRTGQLPEGLYRFTVEVRHFQTGRLISNQGTAIAWIALGKPPMLKTPDNNAQLGQITGMPLTFSWVPSPVAIPGVATQYTFEMWEMRVPGIPPAVVAASMPVFYSATQMNTLLVIPPATLMLEPGMNYAWRVTASDVTGQVPFAQNGQSEVRSFIYQCRCDSVTGFNVERRGQDVTYRWMPTENNSSFNVEVENPVSGWSRSDRVFDTKYEFNSDPDKTYRARVQAICQSNEQNPSDFTAWQTVNIPAIKTSVEICPDCECGDAVPEPPVTNFNLRYDLQPGDTIHTRSGHSHFIIKSVIPQGNGVYKGQFLFWVRIWGVKFLCDYWDLKVNTDNKIIDYDFKSVDNPNFVLDVDAAKEYVNQVTDAVGIIWDAMDKLIDELYENIKLNKDINDYVDNFINGVTNGINSTDFSQLPEFKNLSPEEIEEAKQKTLEAINSKEFKDDLIEKIKENQNGIETGNVNKDAFAQDLKSYFTATTEKAKSPEKGVVIPEERTFVAPDKSLVKLPANAEILYYCPPDEDNIKDYGYLYKFRIGNNIWTGDIKITNIGNNGMSFGGYYSGNEKYNQIAEFVQPGSEVWKVSQLIEYENDNKTIKKRKLSIQKIRVKSLEYPNYYNEAPELIPEETVEVIAACSGSGSGTNDNVFNNLKILEANARANQSVELESWNGNVLTIFTLVNGQLVKVEQPLSDSEIENGKWTDTKENKIRYTVDNNGIIQIKSFGFRQGLKIVDGKQADLVSLSKNIKEKTNKLLQEQNVKSFSTAVPQSSTEAFADGEKIVIGGNNTTYSKLISDGINLTVTLLKTGEIEEFAYLKSTEKTASIHAPGLLTGSAEVGAQRVTDITNLGFMIYDMAFDKEARSQMYNQFKEIKNEIGEDPVNFFPILGEVVLSVATRNTAEQWKATIDGTADMGKRSHLATRGVGNAIMSTVAGVTFVKNLPEITEKLAENIQKVKKGLGSLSEFMAKSLAEKLEDIKFVWKTKYPAQEMMEGRSFFEDVMGEYRYTKADGWAHTADIADNFKGVDFYNNFTVKGNDIVAETAVSMKTTRVTSVDDWLKATKGNIDDLEKGLSSGGITWNGKTIQFNKAELHIYMPKENITPQLKEVWLNKLSNYNSNIHYQINAIEDFIK